MPKRRKIKVDPRKAGALPAIVEPVRKAHKDVVNFDKKMRNPPKPLKRFWPNI